MRSKVSKNNISYFEAGLIAGMLIEGRDSQDIKDLFWSTLTYPNLMRELLVLYDMEEYHHEGLELIYKRMKDFSKEDL